MPMDEADMEHVYEAVFGNGKPGLVAEVRQLQADNQAIKAALYHNPQTGDPGIIARLRRIDEFTARLLTIWQVIAWLIGVAGLGVLVKLFVPGA